MIFIDILLSSYSHIVALPPFATESSAHCFLLWHHAHAFLHDHCRNSMIAVQGEQDEELLDEDGYSGESGQIRRHGENEGVNVDYL